MKATVSLGEVAVITSGKRPTIVEKESSGQLRVPVIGGGGASGFTDKALYDGQILITGRVGTLGKLHVPMGPCWPSDNALVLYPKDGTTDFHFLRYAVQVRIAEAVGMNRGAANPLITQKDLGGLQISHPPLGDQKAIAATLGALDDKIELNRQMNETLEAMARALFRDWFVDFGPTRAKMEGRDPYLAPDLWSLFPDRLDADGKPEGWTVRPLDEIADFLNGLALQKFPADDVSNSLPVIKIAELRSGVSNGSNRASRNVPPQFWVKDGDFLFSWSGSLLAKFWTGGEGALNQHLFKVTSNRYPAWFFSEWVQHHLAEFQMIAASKATTMGHIQRGHLKAALTVCPPDDAIAQLGKAIGPIVERIIHNELESRTLAETRDLLLPRLMSGELQLSEPVNEVSA